MKLGINLSKQEERGSFVFIDCLTDLLSEGGLSNDSGSSRKDSSGKTGSSTTSSIGSRITFSLGRLGNCVNFMYFGDYVHIYTFTPVNQHYVNCIKKCIVPLRVHYRNLTDQFVWLSTI